MPNTRKILIVDDDPEMRDALTEQLSLHEEFEAIAVRGELGRALFSQAFVYRHGSHSHSTRTKR